jgi:hypothetical protein
VWETDQRQVVCEHLAPFLEIWPISGMTRGGSVFALPMSARRMDGSESSSLPTPRATRGGSSTETTALLPTPDASNFNDGQTVEAWAERKERELAKGYNGNGGGTPLAMMVQLLPTPEAKLSDSGPDYARADRDGSGGDDLTTTIHRMLPTPTARLGDGTSRGASHPDRRKELDPKRGGELDEVAVHLLPTPTTEPSTGNGHAKNLGKEAALLPTPRATDGTKGGPNQRGSSGDLMLPSAVLHAQTSSSTTTPEDSALATAAGTAPIPISDDPTGHGTPTRTTSDHLTDSVALLPTPTSRDWKDGACAETDVPTNALLGRAATRLLPTPRAIGDTLTDAATVLTGARTRANSGDRTSQPSDDGSGSPGEQLHLQPSQDETDNLD